MMFLELCTNHAFVCRVTLLLQVQEFLLEWFGKGSNRTLLDKTLNGDESMCFGATM